jgi:hypothetical protein
MPSRKKSLFGLKNNNMKLSTSCFLCDNIVKPCLLTNINNENLYEITCEKGHKSLLTQQCFKFEILFESALYAIKDEYYLESILSLTASMERFFEFYIKFELFQSGVGMSDI